MSFKAQDLVLCVDARPLPEHRSIGVREGAVYTVRQVLLCCATRLALAEFNYTTLYRCTCGAVQPGSYFGWRFVKVGEQGAKGVRVRRTADEVLRDSFRQDATGYLTEWERVKLL